VNRTKRLYRVPEVAELLSVSPKFIWKLIADGRQIAVVRIGRSVRIPAESIDELIARGTTPARRS
jgi:excisionase family DNA binding protein